MRHQLSLKSVANMLTWDRVLLINILILGYDINFARWIWDVIHKRTFHQFTRIPFPYFVQRLCDVIGVLGILKVDVTIEATYIDNIWFIKDDANPFMLYRA